MNSRTVVPALHTNLNEWHYKWQLTGVAGASGVTSRSLTNLRSTLKMEGKEEDTPLQQLTREGRTTTMDTA